MENLKKEIENQIAAKALASFLLFVTCTALSIYTTAYLWNNIMANLFPLPTLTLAQAFAVDWFITYTVVPYSPKGKTFVESAIEVIGKTLMFLIIGWIAIQFI